MGIEHLRAIQAMDPKSYPMGLGIGFSIKLVN